MSKTRKEGLAAYTQFLTDLGCQITEDGFIKSFYSKQGAVGHRKVKIGDLPLALPTEDLLAQPEGSNILFHPLAENALAGESAVLRVITKIAKENLAYRLTQVLFGVAYLIEHPPKKLNAKMRALMAKNPEAPKNFAKKLGDILAKRANTPVRFNLIGIYTRRNNAEIEGKKYARVASVSSSLLDDLEAKKDWDVNGVTAANRKAIIGLIESVLPDLNKEAYSAGSNDRDAPYFDAVSNAWLQVSERLAEVEELIRPHLDAEMTVKWLPEPKHEWVGMNLHKIRGAWPCFNGNGGEIVKTEGVRSSVDTSKIPAPNDAPAGAPAAAPAVQSGKPVDTNKPADPWASNAAPQPMQPTPFGQPAPMQPMSPAPVGGGQAADPWGQPVGMPTQPPGFSNTGGNGSSFA